MNISLPEDLKKSFNINNNYISTIPSTDIKYPENNEAIFLRVSKFLYYLNTRHKKDDKILLCTHQMYNS